MSFSNTPVKHCVHGVNERFFLLKIYVRVKKLCHIWSATCDNAGKTTRRGGGYTTRGAGLSPAQILIHI
jgi:hypothetical protein